MSTLRPYTDWTLMYVAPKILIMAPSTFAYFQAFAGAAQEVHYPAIGFMHNKHNVCMRQRKTDSHFGHIRLPINDPRVVYHDLYSRNFFMTYAELAAEVSALPCWTILSQHVCPVSTSRKFFTGRESRYCYNDKNNTSDAMAARAMEVAHAKGAAAVACKRNAGAEYDRCRTAARARGVGRIGGAAAVDAECEQEGAAYDQCLGTATP